VTFNEPPFLFGWAFDVARLWNFDVSRISGRKVGEFGWDYHICSGIP